MTALIAGAQHLHQRFADVCLGRWELFHRSLLSRKRQREKAHAKEDGKKMFFMSNLLEIVVSCAFTVLPILTSQSTKNHLQ